MKITNHITRTARQVILTVAAQLIEMERNLNEIVPLLENKTAGAETQKAANELHIAVKRLALAWINEEGTELYRQTETEKPEDAKKQERLDLRDILPMPSFVPPSQRLGQDVSHDS